MVVEVSLGLLLFDRRKKGVHIHATMGEGLLEGRDLCGLGILWLVIDLLEGCLNVDLKLGWSQAHKCSIEHLSLSFQCLFFSLNTLFLSDRLWRLNLAYVLTILLLYRTIKYDQTHAILLVESCLTLLNWILGIEITLACL